MRGDDIQQGHSAQTAGERAVKGDNLPQRTSDLLTFDEAANYLRVNRQTFRDWIWRKRLLPYYSVGSTGRRGKPMVRKADLDRFLETRRVPAIEVVDGVPTKAR